MKILFANGRPPSPFDVGGDGKSIHTILRYLSSIGHTCLSVGPINPYGNYDRPRIKKITATLKSMKLPYQYGLYLFKRIDGMNTRNRITLIPKIYLSYTYDYACRMIRSEFFNSEISKILDDFSPNIVITQLDRADTVLRLAHERNIPTILYIHDLEDHNYFLLQKATQFNCAAIIYASLYAKNQFKHIVNCPQKVLYPPVDKNDYITDSKKGQYVTMINPVLLKGGLTFERIVEKMKTDKFLCALGWYDPTKDGINVYQHSNLTVLPKQNIMKNIYRQTKLLPVPSVWRECCPRVIIEAALNGIPSIASNRGGVREAVGQGGILIDDFLNVDQWVSTIQHLLNSPKEYRLLQRNARLHATSFLTKHIMPPFEKFLRTIINI